MREAWVLAYVLEKLMWCKVTVTSVRGGRANITFHDGSGKATWPENEVFDQPDFNECKEIQK